MIRLPDLVAELPPLDRHAPFRATRTCKVCGGRAIQFDQVDFNKYCSPENYFEFGSAGILVTYHRCLACGFVFSGDFDDWSPGEFAALIYNADYIKVDGEYLDDRPSMVARNFAKRLAGCERARILDYGSGAGVFAGRMREAGFRHIESYDPFSSPERPSGLFDIATCFEVLEHTPDPAGLIGDIRSFLRDDGCILFSQTVQPPDILSLRGNWWYLAPRNGHISTYTEEALAHLGARHGLVPHKGGHVYAFAPRHPSSFARLAVASVGPSFATLRLLAPSALADRAIAFPSAGTIHWHPEEEDGLWRFRWTGRGDVAWDAHWGPVAAVQVRVPFLREAEPGLAARCELEMDGRRHPVVLDRGELTAEFDTRGEPGGRIVLRLPTAPEAGRDDEPRPLPGRGLALLLSPEPRWPDAAPNRHP